MAAFGNGVPTQVAVNSGGVTIAAPLIEQYAPSFAPDSYDSAARIPVERGGGVATLPFRVLDYSAFAGLNTLMAARTEVDVVATYVGGATMTWDPCKVRVMPDWTSVAGVKKVLLGASSASETALDAGTGWTDLGVPHGDVSAAWDTGGGTAGRVFYYSWCRADLTALLPGVSPSDITGTFSAMDNVKVALKYGADLYLVFSNMRLQPPRFADQDSDLPVRTVLRVSGAHTAWTSLFAFHDGDSGAATPPDYTFPFMFEAQGYALSDESDLLTPG